MDAALDNASGMGKTPRRRSAKDQELDLFQRWGKPETARNSRSILNKFQFKQFVLRRLLSVFHDPFCRFHNSDSRQFKNKNNVGCSWINWRIWNVPVRIYIFFYFHIYIFFRFSTYVELNMNPSLKLMDAIRKLLYRKRKIFEDYLPKCSLYFAVIISSEKAKIRRVKKKFWPSLLLMDIPKL